MKIEEGGGEVFPFSCTLHLPYYYVLFAFKMAAWRDQCNPLLLEKRVVPQADRAELSVSSASGDMLLNPFSASLQVCSLRLSHTGEGVILLSSKEVLNK